MTKADRSRKGIAQIHIWPRSGVRAGMARVSSYVRITGSYFHYYIIPALLPCVDRITRIIHYSREIILLTVSASTQPRGNRATTGPQVQEQSAIHSTRTEHHLFTHQLLMMHFISWVMSELRIHLYFRYLFCFNIGQARTCIAAQRHSVRVIISSHSAYLHHYRSRRQWYHSHGGGVMQREREPGGKWGTSDTSVTEVTQNELVKFLLCYCSLILRSYAGTSIKGFQYETQQELSCHGPTRSPELAHRMQMDLLWQPL